MKYLLFHTLDTQSHVRFHVPLPVTVTVSTVSAFIFLALTPNIPILFTAIPQHIIHCTGYTAPLKTLQSLQVRRAAMPL